jgi:RHH-type proline utilization regulon transcriptional repressor/proline dehydrogenase/delta 1-pyrroline-5-carboxylate dehydrogenase
LRLLFVQEDIAAVVIDMMIGSMRELSIGDPGSLSTDVGPVIDGRALATLDRHRAAMNKAGRILFACPCPPDLPEGNFFMPHLVEIEHAGKLEREVFGPFLHVVRYPASGLPDVLAWVRGSGYGLTLGIHSRIEATVRAIVDSARVGNVYVNRSMSVAAGTAGDGPAVGGSNGGAGRTLLKFVTERAISGGTLAGQEDGLDAGRNGK